MSNRTLLRSLLVLACALTFGLVVAGCEMHETETTADGVMVGASVAEVEKACGPPILVIPPGDTTRVYKGKSGREYMVTVEDDKIVAIQ